MGSCMCEGQDCPQKEDCYRFTAEANPYRQSYFVYVPFEHETKECEFFTPNLMESKR